MLVLEYLCIHSWLQISYSNFFHQVKKPTNKKNLLFIMEFKKLYLKTATFLHFAIHIGFTGLIVMIRLMKRGFDSINSLKQQ